MESFLSSSDSTGGRSAKDQIQVTILYILSTGLRPRLLSPATVTTLAYRNTTVQNLGPKSVYGNNRQLTSRRYYLRMSRGASPHVLGFVYTTVQLSSLGLDFNFGIYLLSSYFYVS
jgi:hypothetical protein